MFAYYVLPAAATAIIVFALIGWLVTLPVWIYLLIIGLIVGIVLGVRAWRKKTEPNFPIRTLR